MAQTIIVVPCYDEARRFEAERFVAFAERTSRVDFLFVNDGSTDNTLALLRGLEKRDPGRFAVLDQQPNCGKAEAVRRGMLQALGRKPHYAGYWDADLATPLDEIPRFIDVLERNPQRLMAFGARVQLLGRSIERRALRHYLGRVGATLVSRMLDLAIYDTQCGAKLFRSGPEVEALFEEPFQTRWLFDVELIARLAQRRRRREAAAGPAEAIYELPLRSWRDVPGSKVRPQDFAKALAELVRIRRSYLRD